MAKALPKDPVLYDIGGIFLQETEDAILLEVDGDDIWLPKSQIEYDGERGDYMEVEVPDWLCEQKGLDDGDGIGKKTPAEPAPEPVAYTEDDTVSFELFIDNILEDGLLIVEPTSRYDKEKQEFVPVEKNDQTYELRAEDFTTEDDIKVGATITAEIKARAAVEAGLIAPPRLLGEKSSWLKKDVIPYSFDLTDAEKTRGRSCVFGNGHICVDCDKCRFPSDWREAARRAVESKPDLFDHLAEHPDTKFAPEEPC